MKIVVCVKQVPEPGDVFVNKNGEVEERTGAKMLNLFDTFAIEEAIQIKEKNGAQLLAVTLSDEEDLDGVKEALSYGLDEGLLLADERFAHVDAVEAAEYMAHALRKIGDVDLILTGMKTMDYGSGVFGGMVAAELGLPWFTAVKKIEVLENGILLETGWGDTTQLVEVNGPVVLSLSREINEPRARTVKGMMKAKKAKINVWGADEIGDVEVPLIEKATTIGLEAPFEKPAGRLLTGSLPEQIQELVREISS